MQVQIVEEAGFSCAMRGLARSYNQDVRCMPDVAMKLCNKDKGHNTFLESMQVWLDIEAPRFWWSEFDTYRIGVSKQSDSTMHTLKRMPLFQRNFEYGCNEDYLKYLNGLIRANVNIEHIKNDLPDGFLQGRTVNLNYKVIRHILQQRFGHALPQWYCFQSAMHGLKHFKYLGLN
jgi:hypothetical protein